MCNVSKEGKERVQVMERGKELMLVEGRKEGRMKRGRKEGRKNEERVEMQEWGKKVKNVCVCVCVFGSLVITTWRRDV